MKYQVIYADPPWRYEHPISDSRKIENQYPTMELDEIKNLRVPSEDNSVLFLWATAPKLQEAMEVLQAWGFNYRTCAIWDKEVIGMGYWFRNQHEILLVGIKGEFSPPEPESRISSILREPRGKHSAKPDFIKYLIGEWYPNKTKIELFARKNQPNLFQQDQISWAVWGNEIKNDIEIYD
jgi:N6-adenosine-specific RNA methylase IME4